MLVQRTIRLYDPQGKEIAAWEHPWLVWESQLHFWGDRLIANIHHRNSMAVYSRTGELVSEFSEFEGGPGKLYSPMAFGISSGGDLLIEQLDGQALRFQLDGPDFKPRFVETFRVNTSTPGTNFDGPDKILVPSERGLRVFGRGGRRLMASNPKRDVSQLPFGIALRVHVDSRGRLLVLDADRQTLWSIRG